MHFSGSSYDAIRRATSVRKATNLKKKAPLTACRRGLRWRNLSSGCTKKSASDCRHLQYSLLVSPGTSRQDAVRKSAVAWHQTLA